MKLFLSQILFIFITSVTIAQVSFQETQIALDDSLNIAVFHLKDSIYKNVERFTLNTIEYSLQFDASGNAQLSNTKTNKVYQAYNTPLPLIQINAPNGIVDEPKSLCTILYADKHQSFTSHAGIELRGSSSKFFPKKTYDLNFYTDETMSENRDISIHKMRKDDDWILDGIYNEPLRLRSHLSLSLWRKIHTPHYIDQETKAKAGVKTRYCEVFVDGHYKGIYLLSEQVDRKLLKIKKQDSTGIRGELFQGSAYAGAVTFDSIPPKKNFLSRWGGYDIEYPYPNDTPWDNLYDFTEIVVRGSDSAFAKAVSSKIHLDNVIDYFLFVNAVRAPDNLGKNIYLARYDKDKPYFYVPWDLDGTFGTIFSGKRIETTNDFLSNGLLRRLLTSNPNDFVKRFKQRWLDLRASVLHTDTLLAEQKKQYQKLIKSGGYEREQLVWKDFKWDIEGIEYIEQWTEKRLEFLDDYIQQLDSTKTD